MPAPSNTLLIEGTFEELVDELATYIDSLKKTQGEESSLQSECAPLLQEPNDEKRIDVLKKVVTASTALNSAPEKEFLAAYNLLIHLVRQAPDIDVFLPRLCNNLTQPITSSTNNGPALALSALTTLFNILQPDDESRFHVFLAVIGVVKTANNFESLRPQLKNLDSWLEEWEMDEEDQRKLFLAISEAAKDSGEEASSYQYLVRALRTIPSSEASNDEAKELSLQAVKSALSHPTHFDFQDLTSLDSVQALRQSETQQFELLEIFNSEMLDDFNDFQDEHDGWIEEQGMDAGVLTRKMRLLTLASIAASSGQARSLPYAQIARALQIPSEDVEMWVIDVIRAGLVEGKLSQLNQTFLIHRSTYRVFGENQWREVSSRLDMWRTSLTGVLQVIRQEKEKFIVEKEQELRDVEAKLNGTGNRGGYRNQRRQEPQAMDVDLD